MTTNLMAGSQFTIWKGQPAEVVGAAKDADGCPYVLLRFVLSDNQGAWVPAYKSMRDNFEEAGPVAVELFNTVAI